MNSNNTKKITDADSLTVSAAVLGSIFGVSDRRIRQMAEEGILSRAAKGRYNFTESVKYYILSLKLALDSKNNENPDSELDLDEEKAIHENIKRQITELKLQTMRGELHKASDVEKVMTDMLSSFKTRLLNIPSKSAPILVNRADTGFIQNFLTKEIHEVLNELKDYNPSDFYSEEYVEVEDGINA